MDEEQWLACSEPGPMLDYLWGRASDRKWRLFCCATCRCVWHWMPHEESRRAVEVAERFADGLVNAQTVEAACFAANRVLQHVGFDDTSLAQVRAAAADCASSETLARVPWFEREDEDKTWQCHLVREIFPSPFRPVTISPAWRTWRDGLVVRLAEAAYDERNLPAGTLDNARLAVLADALEEAGCQDVQILGHLRAGGDHYRGCWALDLVLGKS